MALEGILGGGGVPVYCALNICGLGEPDILGLSLVKSAALSLGLLLLIFRGFEDDGLLNDGEDMARGSGGGWRERDECGVFACSPLQRRRSLPERRRRPSL